MPTITLKNTTGVIQTLPDLGTFIPASGQMTVDDPVNLRDVGASGSVRALVQAGTLVVNDGANDLSIQNGLSYLSSVWALSGFTSRPAAFYTYPYQPPFARRQWAIQQSDGTTTLVGSGYGTLPTINGTPSAVSDADGQFVSYLSAAQLARDAGWVPSAFNQTRRQERVTHGQVVKTGPAATDIQNARIWGGLFSANPMAVSAPGSIQCAAFRYSTDVDGTAFWRAVTSDGASATITTTTVAVAANTAYEFFIDMSDPAKVDFYINGVLVATHTTNLPSLSQQLAYVATLRTLSAAARTYLLKRVFTEHL